MFLIIIIIFISIAHISYNNAHMCCTFAKKAIDHSIKIKINGFWKEHAHNEK